MAKTEIGRFGNLNDNYGYLTDVYGLAIGRYETGRPNLIYDSATGKMSFNVYNTPYMVFEYNSGNPRVYLGNTVNSVELVTSGLSVGTTGKISGGDVIYGYGDGFWLGYDAGKYKAYIGNASNSLKYDGTNLTLTGAFQGTKTSFSDDSDGFWLGPVSGTYKLYIGNTTEYIKWDGDSLTIAGGITTDTVNVGTTGAVYGGQSDWDTGVGFWLGYKTDAHKLSFGSSTGKKLLWDGTNLTWTTGKTSAEVDGTFRATDAIISGTITANTGYIGGPTGWAIATGKITSAGIGVATIAGDGTYAFWAGDNTPSSAEFSVKHDGSLKATSAEITGVITANTGFIGGSSGWTIAAGKITSTGIGVATATGDGTYAFWAGDDIPASAEYSVKHDGTLTARNAIVSGTVFANQGYFGTGGNIVTVDSSGLLIGGSGTIRGNKTNFASDDAGFWLGAESDVYKFKIGDSSKNIIWDGINLTINADVTVNSLDVADGGYVRGGQTAYNTGTGFWLGDSGGSLFQFSVGVGGGKSLLWDGSNLSVGFGNTAIGSDGVLHAQSAIISGTITANTGYIGGPTGWTIATGKITSTGIGLATAGGDGTYAFWAGDDTPLNAEFSVQHNGTFKSTAGTVGGWTIGASSLTAGSGASTVGLDITGGSTPAFYAGSATPGSAPFRVYQNGSVTATSATISGEITANSGRIGGFDGWVIDSGVLYSKNLKITLDASNDYIKVGGIHLHGSDSTIHSDDYASGISGFTLSPDYLEVNNINARGMIRTAVFQKDTLSVVGGTVMVLPGDVLDADMTALDASTMTVSGTHTFSLNDVVRIKDGTYDEWLEITNIASAPTYTVTRDKAGSYAANNNPAWKRGSTVVSYQGWSQGGLQLTSSLTNAPYLSIFVRPASTTYPYSNGGLIEKVRLGNLTGIADTSGYGLWTDNCYLTGKLQTGSGNKKIVIDNSDNTLRFYDSSGYNTIVLDDTLSSPATSGMYMAVSGGSTCIYSAKLIQMTNGTAGFNYNTSALSPSGYGNDICLDSRLYGQVSGTAYDRRIAFYTYAASAAVAGDLADYFGIKTEVTKSTKSGNYYSLHSTADSGAWAGYFSGNIFASNGIYVGTSTTTNCLLDDSVHGSGNTTLYIGNASIDVTVSDGRYKNIVSPTTRGLALLDRLQVIDYKWKESFNVKDKKLHVGLIAQDTFSIDEALAKKPENEETGLWVLSNDDLIGLCVKSIQELHTKIKDLEKDNKTLHKKVKELEKKCKK